MTQPEQQTRAPIVGDPKKPRIFSVRTTTGDYIIGGFVPNPKNPEDMESQISEIYRQDDGSIDVYALSTSPESAFNLQNVGIVITIPAIHVVQIWMAARKDLWSAMQRELSDMAVAQLVAAWTGLPSDLVADHMDEMREMEEGEPEAEVAAPVAAAPPTPAPPSVLPTPVANPNGSPS